MWTEAFVELKEPSELQRGINLPVLVGTGHYLLLSGDHQNKIFDKKKQWWTHIISSLFLVLFFFYKSDYIVNSFVICFNIPNPWGYMRASSL